MDHRAHCANAGNRARQDGHASQEAARAPRRDRKDAPGRHRKDAARQTPRLAPGQASRQTTHGPTHQPPTGNSRAAWPVESELFPPLDAAAQAALARLPEALARVWPLSAAHRRSLPGDVAALSRLLTETRAGLRRPYWSRPQFVSAYLYYFLPWNLVRLMRLCQGLPLPEPCPGGARRGLPSLLADAGSGPLTLPLALWLARPQWRALPIRVLALDSVLRPLELGRALFAALGSVLDEPVWDVHLVRGPLETLSTAAAPLLGRGRRRSGQTDRISGPDHAGQSGQPGQPADRARVWLVAAANALNELRPLRAGHLHGAALASDGAAASGNGDDPESAAYSGTFPDEYPDEHQDERLERLLNAWRPLLSAPADGNNSPEKSAAPGQCVAAERGADPAPALLLVEPGTRLGGTTLMRMRDLALASGLRPLAPCVCRTGGCPLRGRGAAEADEDRTGTPRSWRGSWCHFTVPVEGAPPWLAALSAQAGLAKRSLALSALLLAPACPDGAQTRGATRLRVLSSPFAVPGVAGLARYACAPWGLALLERAGALPCGALVRAQPQPEQESGPHSGPVVTADSMASGSQRPTVPVSPASSARLDGRSGARLVAPPAPGEQARHNREALGTGRPDTRPRPADRARRAGGCGKGGKKSQKK